MLSQPLDARVGIEQWRRHYNAVRPHSSLGYLTPAQDTRKHLADLMMDGGCSPALPARADPEEQCALTIDARRLVPCER
jgi:hypothetical protein